MSKEINPAADTNRPWSSPWPAEELEKLEECPICSSKSRRIMHPDLVDNTFYCAPGRWTLWSCNSCKAAYLDPRPTSKAIVAAYARYYTHNIEQARLDYKELGSVRKVRRRLANGYTNWKYGSQRKPSSSLGIIAAYLMPSMKGSLDIEYRHLPRSGLKKLSALDVGCGSGSFLEIAQSCGWYAQGVDPDEIAVANARARKLNVSHGGIELFDEMENVFDFISLKHVIEHLHDPVRILRDCQRLLKPGGRIWIETPNINSFGHQVFGSSWRGIEAPRHLVVFSPGALVKALTDANFKKVKTSTHRDVYVEIFRASAKIRSGRNLSEDHALPFLLSSKARLARLAATLISGKREFLSVVAEKS